MTLYGYPGDKWKCAVNSDAYNIATVLFVEIQTYEIH